MTTEEPRLDFYAAVPRLREIGNDLIYGDIWERPQLSKRDRSMITIAALVAMRGRDEVGSHVNRALDNGVTKEEISELLTHITFYVGWPAGINGAQAAQEVFDQRGI
jgi:4-carboxymuconolactone decarboxylase